MDEMNLKCAGPVLTWVEEEAEEDFDDSGYETNAESLETGIRFACSHTSNMGPGGSSVSADIHEMYDPRPLPPAASVRKWTEGEAR